jgi:hypothetical protein
MPKDIEVIVICPELEEDVLGAVPLVEYFLDKILTSAELKANRSFVCLAACITLDAKLHRYILAHK